MSSSLLLLLVVLSILMAAILARPGENGGGVRKPGSASSGGHGTPGSEAKVPITDGADGPSSKERERENQAPGGGIRPGQDGHGVRHPPAPSEGGAKTETRGMAGGWSSIAVNDPEVIKCSEFALANGSFAQQSVAKFEVKSARKQVVAGLNIDMTIDVHLNGKCFVRSFTVYDRFGQLSLTKEEEVAGATCGN